MIALLRYAAVVLCLLVVLPSYASDPPFRIQVVDAETGRGIPLVELRTTNEIRWFTDSAGNAAIDEPGLVGQRVYFNVRSNGYSYKKDNFGYSGESFDIKPGGSGVIRMTRMLAAERLYRTTGEGIYRDTVLLGLTAPLKNPLLNGLMMGQDTVETTRYKGKLYWFYGDTNRPAYPLGNFHTSGATTLLPAAGGLDPEVGVDLNYFTGPDGFCREMLKSNLPGPIWVGGLCVVRDDAGNERLICNFARMKSLGEPVERGLSIFNDSTSGFDPLCPLDIIKPICPIGHPTPVRTGSRDLIYAALPDGVPALCVRVPAELKAVQRPQSYESYTCLALGERYHGATTRLDRDARGQLAYAWKHNTDALGWKEEETLVKAGSLKQKERLLHFRDVETGKTVNPASGSAYWNGYLHKWVMILQEVGGTSLLGEVWYAYADTPTGPWVYARKVVTHNNYSFYNPTQDPYLDSDGGKRIHFEGTYTQTFTQNADPTPRYEYNQIMYALSLDRPELALPEPVYQYRTASNQIAYGRFEDAKFGKIEKIAFFAPGRPGVRENLMPVTAGDGSRLLIGARTNRSHMLFYALPQVTGGADETGPIEDLYQFKGQDKQWHYTTDKTEAGPNSHVLCRVWCSPLTVLPLDMDAKPQ